MSSQAYFELSLPKRPVSTLALVEAIKDAEQDFEWYPTTPGMLALIKDDIDKWYRPSLKDAPSVLDCGAGDGRALEYLTTGPRYAIEKSQPLIQQMDPSVFIVGTEFRQQTLIDKAVGVIFANPPYSEYADWVEKIIREGNASYAYFVVPRRWKDNKGIREALERREAKTTTLGEFDFTNAERQARAKVEIIRVDLCYSGEQPRPIRIDPFTAWFEDNFKLEINTSEPTKFDWRKLADSNVKTKLKNELVAGADLVSTLAELYQAELARLMDVYKALETIDPELLNEMNVNLKAVKIGLQQKVEGLKDLFWKELFDNMGKITSRLSHKNRDRMLKRLTAHTHIDFTASNAYAILIWVIKQSNAYFDEQIVTLVERMTEEANIVLYKSNERTFGREEWAYCRRPEGLDRYSLDYQVVLHRAGGINTSSSNYERSKNNGLVRSAYELVNDILTVANNLGFDTTVTTRAGGYQWEPGKRYRFDYYDSTCQHRVDLMTVKAFKNGNLHIKLNEALICRLNVEFGRLKGWLKQSQDAVDEMGVSQEVASEAFGSNLQLSSSSASLLLSHGSGECPARLISPVGGVTRANLPG